MIYKEFDEKQKAIPYSTKEDRANYRKRCSEIEDEFKAKLFAEYGVAKHPKAELLYQLCYREAHAGGFNDIECMFADFSELLRVK